MTAMEERMKPDEIVPITTQTPTNGRIHALDAVRASALLLGIALHATLPYIKDLPGWAIVETPILNGRRHPRVSASAAWPVAAQPVQQEG